MAGGTVVSRRELTRMACIPPLGRGAVSNPHNAFRERRGARTLSVLRTPCVKPTHCHLATISAVRRTTCPRSPTRVTCAVRY
jgi:hypothetical protein